MVSSFGLFAFHVGRAIRAVRFAQPKSRALVPLGQKLRLKLTSILAPMESLAFVFCMGRRTAKSGPQHRVTMMTFSQLAILGQHFQLSLNLASLIFG